MAKRYFWNNQWHTVPNPYGGSGMFEGVRVTPPPATSVSTAQPLDPNAENRKLLIQQHLGDQLASFDQQEGSIKRGFGLDDPTDPFSRAALLKESYQNRTRGTTNSYAASGQLYSGAIQNAQNTNANNYTQGVDSLRKQQDDLIAQLVQRRADAKYNAAAGILDTDQAALTAASATQPDLAEISLPQQVTTSARPRKIRRRRR